MRLASARTSPIVAAAPRVDARCFRALLTAGSSRSSAQGRRSQPAGRLPTEPTGKTPRRQPPMADFADTATLKDHADRIRHWPESPRRSSFSRFPHHPIPIFSELRSADSETCLRFTHELARATRSKTMRLMELKIEFADAKKSTIRRARGSL